MCSRETKHDVSIGFYNAAVFAAHTLLALEEAVQPDTEQCFAPKLHPPGWDLPYIRAAAAVVFALFIF